jgi:hypothetical protein
VCWGSQFPLLGCLTILTQLAVAQTIKTTTCVGVQQMLGILPLLRDFGAELHIRCRSGAAEPAMRPDAVRAGEPPQ